jgi:hypothetical protein
VPGGGDIVILNNTPAAAQRPSTDNIKDLDLAELKIDATYATTLTLGTDLTVQSGEMDSGTIDGSGNLTLSGYFTFKGGTLTGTGNTIVAADAKVGVSTALDKSIILKNYEMDIKAGGTVNLQGNIFFDGASTIQNEGLFTVLGGTSALTSTYAELTTGHPKFKNIGEKGELDIDKGAWFSVVSR